MTNNTQDSRGLRIAVITVVALVAFYSLSLAPVQWMLGQGYIDGSDWRELRIYTPVVLVADHCPNFIKQTIEGYAWLFTPYRTRGGVI